LKNGGNNMAHKKLNRPETGICREPPAFYEGCSSLLGLWHKKSMEREANSEQLIAAGFLLPREPAPPPKPREPMSFSNWAIRHEV
jgi:hypothetical protein